MSVSVSPSTSKMGSSHLVFQWLILALICILAFSTRLFSVVKSEAMIHEFGMLLH